MIVFILGKMGAGKTTALRKFVQDSECIHIEFDWQKHELRQRKAYKKEAYSSYLVNGKKVALVGSYHKPAPNKLGGDTFLFERKDKLANFLMYLNSTHDLVLYDGTSISPTVLEAVLPYLQVLYLNTPSEKCVESRNKRMKRPKLVQDEELYKDFEKTERQFEFLSSQVKSITCTRRTILPELTKLLGESK